ncbi:MAG: GGDEF domain-containing protein [Ruminococcus sp.]|nr:GGDEF domain-containing protein [Ruminococcus sp.]
MGRLLVESIETLENGGDVPEKATVGFDVIRSQSCGCEPVHATNVNDVLNSLMDRLRLSKNRQDLMCSIQSSVSKMADISELPSVLIDKFAFHTNVFALTRDVFEEPDFGAGRRGSSAYADRIDVVYHRYFWDQKEPCTIPTSQLFPDISLLTVREEPIVICSVHFLDMIMGYCVFQPEIDFDEYEKFHTLMSAIDASMGNFHGRLQIKSINTKLVEVNSELKHLSDHDHMTGLMNRRGFYSELSRMISAKRSGECLVVLISADLDGLKEINDSFGHLEGDSAITTVARALISCSVQDEICARFGGDEFSAVAVISESLGKSYIKGFRERFEDYLSRYNESSGKPYKVEASIGFYSEMLSDYFDIDRMIKNADERMYEHKISRRRERK